MRKTFLIMGTVLVAGLFLFVACAPVAVEEGEGEGEREGEGASLEEEVVVTEEEEVTVEEVAPAKFEIRSLNIKPLEVMPGETVSITTVVENIGGIEGTYAVILTVDGVTVEAKEVAITTGSSAVVTFSLVKDAPGTYKIAVGELSSSLTVTEKLVIKEIELKYDDGKVDSFAAQVPSWGYSVFFSPPDTPFTIEKVKLVAYVTEYADQKATLEIWDENLEVLYSNELLATEFSLNPGWVTAETNITVDGDFRVVFFTNWGGQEDRILLGYDSGEENKHSELVRTGGLLADWPPQVEETKPEATTKWMIRVIGTYMAPQD